MNLCEFQWNFIVLLLRHPLFWYRISSHGMQALRASPFLFARKFLDQPVHLDEEKNFSVAYPRIVFAPK